MSDELLKWFEYKHLPDDLQDISYYCSTLAILMDDTLPASTEKTVGLRKLLEAKDCFVRAKLESRE